MGILPVSLRAKRRNLRRAQARPTWIHDPRFFTACHYKPRLPPGKEFVPKRPSEPAPETRPTRTRREDDAVHREPTTVKGREKHDTSLLCQLHLFQRLTRQGRQGPQRRHNFRCPGPITDAQNPAGQLHVTPRFVGLGPCRGHLARDSRAGRPRHFRSAATCNCPAKSGRLLDKVDPVAYTRNIWSLSCKRSHALLRNIAGTWLTRLPCAALKV
jgi:hypothetical protein